MINLVSRRVGLAAFTAFAVSAAPAVRAYDGHHDGDDNRYVVTNLVSDIAALGGKVIDPLLQNAWGVAFSPAGSPFWIADNVTGCATLYDGDGTIVTVKGVIPVSLPLPGGSVPATACVHVNPPPAPPPDPTPAAPTGIIWNPSSAFVVPGSVSSTNPNGIPAAFIFDTEDGTVSAWAGGLTPPNNAVLAVDNSKVPNAANGAVYKGLAFGVNVHGAFLFATNFRAGTIDVFGPPSSPGGLFTVATTDGDFSDPNIPDGFAPFGIQNINGNLFVTYAKQKLPDKHDDMAGPGNGFVDVFDTDGHLLRRLASHGLLNSPWAVARASFAFGKFSDDVVIGNFGDGRINAVINLADREASLVPLKDANGKPIVIDGLWTLTLGGGAKSSPSTLYFTAGPNGETDGLFGTITPVSNSDDN